MKYMTINDINILKDILAAKTDRIGALERMIAKIVEAKKDMSEKELRAAAEELYDLERDLASEKEWCNHVKATIAKFYTPASIAV